MKIGRNEPCPCGSGKKFKRCCIDKPKSQTRPVAFAMPPEVRQRAQEMMRVHEAQENVRQQQQGHGNPILSWTDHGYRLVAVRNTIHWAENWVIFPNFLDYFMKKTLGHEWGESEKPKGAHPIFRWLEKTQKYSSHKPGEPKVKTITMMGFIACWLHLAYALYLIAHNDAIPKSLLTRLRNTVTFMPAYYEAIVGAALAVAGFELSSAETKATSTPTPEFRVKSKTTGTTYEVEAKRKERWKSPTDDVSNADFQSELRSYVRDQVHAASKKKLKNPIYWFELSIPTLRAEADWRAVAAKVEETLREAEASMTVGGEPIQPAFVAITNHTFLANEDIEGEPSFAFLATIKTDDYPFGRPVEIEAALEGYDKYRDIFWMMEAWKVARTVPTTFDGTPPELLSPDGEPQRTIKIGDMVEAQDADGRPVQAKVTEIASMGDRAMVALTANGRSWLSEMPLTQGEADAAKRFTDAVFGKDNASRGLRDADPFDLYDFLLRAHARMTQEQVDKFFADNPTVAHYKGLPLKDARVRIAREYTKWTWIRTKHKETNPPPIEPIDG
jgi:hypothetical protein